MDSHVQIVVGDGESESQLASVTSSHEHDVDEFVRFPPEGEIATYTFDCSETDITHLPHELRVLENLEHLNCSRNSISRLRVLHPVHGPLEDLHSLWPNLKILDCSKNSLSDLPTQLNRACSS